MRVTTLRRLLPILAALAVMVVVAGCDRILQASPAPTPMDFPGIAGELATQGILIGHPTAGDDGCHDSSLAATAIGFDATGPGLTTPTHLRVYIFNDGAAFDRRRPDVDTCVAKWATDPATVEFVDASPFVVAGQGPWPEAFKAAMRAALTTAAGNGG